MSQTIEHRLWAAGLPPLPRLAWLEIDLDRLAANVEAVRAALPAGVRVDAVVKADAYGHGAVAVASWLEHERVVDGLCVATVDEGLELRRAGITLPVLVLYAVPRERIEAAAAAGIAVTIGDASALDAIDAARAADAGLAIDVELEVETGLGRAGASAADAPLLVERIRRTSGLRLTGLWSHLAAPADAIRTGMQRQAFDAAIDAVAEAVGGASPSLHLAATGGLLAASAPAYDRVRLGLGLYGLTPDEMTPSFPASSAAARLRPVMSLHARPIRVADLPAGHGVSYGPSFETSRPSRIATLPLGYGDGWPRVLSNRAVALTRGRRVPLVGTVAMDAVMADVTDVAGPPVTLDDEFVLLGEQAGAGAAIGAAELAQARTSISWEVVTNMARRLPRVYHAAAVPVGLRTLTEEILAWLPESSSGTETSVTSRWTRS